MFNNIDTVLQQLLVFKNIFSCTFDVPAEELTFTYNSILYQRNDYAICFKTK